MSEGADEECIGLDSGRGYIKLRNFNEDISNDSIFKNGSQISLLGRDEECLGRHQISWLAWLCIGSGGWLLMYWIYVQFPWKCSTAKHETLCFTFERNGC